MKRTMIKFAAIASLALAGTVHAGVSVVANPDVGDVTLSADEVTALFLAKANSVGSVDASPVDQEGNAVRETFVEEVMGRNESQMKSYWSRLVFTGKGEPPQAFSSDAEVLDYVRSNSGAIGYVDSAADTSGTNVVFTLN